MQCVGSSRAIRCTRPTLDDSHPSRSVPAPTLRARSKDGVHSKPGRDDVAIELEMVQVAEAQLHQYAQ